MQVCSLTITFGITGFSDVMKTDMAFFGATEKQPNSSIHFRLMAPLSLKCVSMSFSLPLGLGGSRSNVARACSSQTQVLTHLRGIWAIRRKRIKEIDCFSFFLFLTLYPCHGCQKTYKPNFKLNGQSFVIYIVDISGYQIRL